MNPIVDPRLDANGRLTFENAAVDGWRGAAAPATYRASWLRFDNATGTTKPLSETQSATTTIAAPSGLPTSGFVAVDIAADSTTYPTWKQPVRAYFRQDGGAWKLVGFERLPDKMPSRQPPRRKPPGRRRTEAFGSARGVICRFPEDARWLDSSRP